MKLNTIDVCDIVFNDSYNDSYVDSDKLAKLANDIISQLPEPTVDDKLVIDLVNQLDDEDSDVSRYKNNVLTDLASIDK